MSLKTFRKRKKGVLRVDTEVEDGGGPQQTETPHPEERKATENENEVKEKKKSDDLWATFLSDVGSRPKDSTSAPPQKVLVSV